MDCYRYFEGPPNGTHSIFAGRNGDRYGYWYAHNFDIQPCLRSELSVMDIASKPGFHEITYEEAIRLYPSIKPHLPLPGGTSQTATVGRRGVSVIICFDKTPIVTTFVQTDNACLTPSEINKILCRYSKKYQLLRDHLTGTVVPDVSLD